MKRKSIIFMIALALTLVLSVAALSACDKNKDDPPVTYTVTVNGGAGGGEYAEGETVTITANAPATGKEFTSWTIEGVTVDDKTKAEITFTMPANAVTATANYGDKAYLFALENCTADKETAKFGEQVTFTADEVIGKRFDSWNIKGVDDLTGLDLTKSPLTITMPANDIVVAAQLEDIEYEVFVPTGSGTADKVKAKYGEIVTVTADVTTPGKEFAGWQIIEGLDAEGLDLTKPVLTFEMPACKVHLMATYNYIEYKVTVVGGTAQVDADAEPTSEAFATYECSVSIFADTAPTGQRFVRWTSEDGVVFDNAESAETTFTMPDKNVTVTAVFEYIDYTVSVTGGTAQVNGGVASASVKAHYGEQVTITANASEKGMKFDRWTITGIDASELDLTARELTFTMPANVVTATANYDFINYTVSVTGGTADKTTAHYGEQVTITANAPTGKEFVMWSFNGLVTDGLTLTDAELTFTMPAGNVTARANYKNVNYTVIVNGGTANVTSAHYGDNVTITANVPTGKDFVMWSFEGFAPDGLTLTNPELTFTMPDNAVTATAVFEDIDYEVKVICDNTETKTAHYGEEVTITAKNIEGKIFVCWAFTNLDTEGLDLTRAELSFTMPANNVTAKAIYEELITLTFEGSTAQSEELQYKDNDSKSFRLPLGSGQDICTYTIELSNSAFTFKVYGSDGVEIEPYDNGDGIMCIDIEREDNYTIRVVNTGSAANCTLTVTQI